MSNTEAAEQLKQLEADLLVTEQHNDELEEQLYVLEAKHKELSAALAEAERTAQQLRAQLAQHLSTFSLEEILDNEAALGLEEP